MNKNGTLVVFISNCQYFSATPSVTILAALEAVLTLKGDSRANVPMDTKPLITHAQTLTNARLTSVESTETVSISRDLINVR